MSDQFEDVAVRSRAELLGLVPYLLEYHPADSVVALFLDKNNVQCLSRVDMTTPAAVAVQEWSRVTEKQATSAVLVIGYGTRSDGPHVAAIADALAAHAPVIDALLVTEERFFCLRCPCPDAGGTRFDPAATAVAARATLSGRVALDSRDQLVGLTDADPAAQATISAELAQLPAETDAPGPLLRYLLEVAADGQQLSAEQGARLVRLLRDRHARDLAWEATGELMWQRDLWLDLTRRAPAGSVAAPATLAGWCAWQRGEHTLACAAVRRALADDPSYLLAQLIGQALQHNLRAQQLFGDPAAEVTAGETR